MCCLCLFVCVCFVVLVICVICLAVVVLLCVYVVNVSVIVLNVCEHYYVCVMCVCVPQMCLRVLLGVFVLFGLSCIVCVSMQNIVNSWLFWCVLGVCVFCMLFIVLNCHCACLCLYYCVVEYCVFHSLLLCLRLC